MKKDLRLRKEKHQRKGDSVALINPTRLLAVIIATFILLFKLLPDSAINTAIGKISGTSTDFVKMIKEIDEVIIKHTMSGNMYAPPCTFLITSPFGERVDPITGEPSTHTGIDYDAPLLSPVKASCNGQVSRVEENAFYGKFIMIKHEDGIETLYGHLEEFSVNIGDNIKKGDIIAKSGNSGKSTGAHLHFEIRKDGVPVDPNEYLI